MADDITVTVKESDCGKADGESAEAAECCAEDTSKADMQKSVVFFQVMTVIAILIILVIFKYVGGGMFEKCRLKMSNMIADTGGYEDIVYPAGDNNGEET